MFFYHSCASSILSWRYINQVIWLPLINDVFVSNLWAIPAMMVSNETSIKPSYVTQIEWSRMNWQLNSFVTYDFRYQSVIQRVWDNSDMIRFLKRRVTGGYLPCRGSVIVLLALFVIVGSVFFIHSSWNKGRGVVRPPTYNRKDEIPDGCSNPICIPRKECHKQEVRKCQAN